MEKQCKPRKPWAAAEQAWVKQAALSPPRESLLAGLQTGMSLQLLQSAFGDLAPASGIQ